MLSFRFLGIPVFVQPWFWITMALIGGALRANDSASILMTLMFVLAGFISILCHEIGHALMIRKYRFPTEIHLVAFGGFARFPSGQLERKQSFLVTAAGPALQFVLGIIALIALQLISVPEGSLLQALLVYLMLVSFFWSILNCLPVYPLDGGQMLSSILGPQRSKIVHLIGVFVSVAIGLFAFFVMRAWILMLFMGFFAYQNWQQYQNTVKR